MEFIDILRFENLHSLSWYFDDHDNILVIEDQSFDYYYTFNLKLPLSIKGSDILLDNIIQSPEKYLKIKVESIKLLWAFRNSEEDDDYGFKIMNGELFSILQLYYSLFSQIPGYKIFDDFGDVFCAGPTLTKIEINCDKLSIIELNKFYISLQGLVIETIANFDFTYDKKTINPTSNIVKINIISTNTKARRLGYLKYIIELFNKSRFYPINYFSKLIEREALKINNELDLHLNDKGLIQLSRSGNSSKPYIELLIGLSLITIINNSYILTKQSKIYFVINNLILESKISIFENIPDLFSRIIVSKFRLNLFDKLFFLRQILIKDTLYFCSILDIFRIINKETDNKTLKLLFRQYVLNELIRTNNRRDTKVIIDRIKSWKKELVYLEHIIEPRLNWMIDLELITSKISDDGRKLYTLSTYGFKLQKILSSFYERSMVKVIPLENWLDDNYFKLFTQTFVLGKLQANFNESAVLQYLNDAFIYFKTDAPNRIPVSVAINYICFMYYMKLDKIIEFNQLKYFLLNSKSDIYGIDWFVSENDGSIFLKRK